MLLHHRHHRINLRHQQQRRGSAKGFALIAALWCLALLTVLATAVTALSVGYRRAGQRNAEAVTLDALADSALRVAVLRMIAPGAPGTVGAVTSDLHLDLPQGNAVVQIERDDGRIDLNTADDDLLFALFAANGWKPDAARAMVARIADWKDANDEVRENGAEEGAYQAAGLPYGPRNGPFEITDELRQVLGAENISDALMDSLTVYTHSQIPKEDAAPEPVRRALKFADENQLGGHHWLSAGGASAAPGSTGDTQAFIGQVVRLRACARNEVAQRCRLLVARMTGSVQRPLQVFAWTNVADERVDDAPVEKIR